MLHPDFGDPLPDALDDPTAVPIELPPQALFLVDRNELIDTHAGYALEPRKEVDLTAGDYSLQWRGECMEAEVTVERKSLADLLGCCGNGRRRWEESLGRLATVRRPCVVVETTWANIAQGEYLHTKMHPHTVMGSVVSWMLRLRVPFVFAGSATRGEQFTRWFLTKAAQDFLRLEGPIRAQNRQHSACRGG